MTSVASTLRPSSRSGGNERSSRLIPATRTWRPALGVFSVILVVASVAVFTAVYERAGHLVSVLSVVRVVQQGHVIGTSDLGITRVAISGGVATFQASSAGQVVGRIAAETLQPGTLLSPLQVVQTSTVPPGYAVVGVALSASQLPADGVVVGQEVDVVLTGQRGSPDTQSSVGAGAPAPAGSTQGMLAQGVEVIESAIPPASATGSNVALVSLEVPLEMAATVATASAAGQVALIVVTPAS